LEIIIRAKILLSNKTARIGRNLFNDTTDISASFGKIDQYAVGEVHDYLHFNTNDFGKESDSLPKQKYQAIKQYQHTITLISAQTDEKVLYEPAC